MSTYGHIEQDLSDTIERAYYKVLAIRDEATREVPIDDLPVYLESALEVAINALRALEMALFIECETCGAPLVRAATGRPRRFCGDSCRKASSRRS